jgi:lipoprotein-releasing system ATP-binding protein
MNPSCFQAFMLEVRNLSKEYPMPGQPLRVLTEVDFCMESGDSVSVVGPSGSGKSTLLYILGALEPPTSGTVSLEGLNPFEMDEKVLAEFRNQKIGFVFQDHHLLPQCTVVENVLVPTLVARENDLFYKRAIDLLEHVGLSSRIHHHPYELSGGEKQRVAVARALIMQPQLVLCDEPTGNLDHNSAEAVTSLLLDLHQKQQTILIVVTHNPEVAAKFKLKYELAGTHLHN